MLHGWKDDSMLVKRIAAYIHLSLTVYELARYWSEFRKDLETHKTRMNGLSCGEESITICSAVLIQYQRVTDRQWDGRTDVQPIAKTCFSITDAPKNYNAVSTIGLPKWLAGKTRHRNDRLYVECDVKLRTLDTGVDARREQVSQYT